MKRLVAFDLDGTLIPRTTSAKLIAEALGHKDVAEACELELTQGKIDSIEVANRLASYLKDVSLADIQRVYSMAPKIQGIREVVDALRTQDCYIILGSITWKFFVGMFAAEFGFHDYCGTEMGSADGKLTGVVSRYFTSEDKATFCTNTAANLGIPLANCIAVGDSRSDHPVFASAGLSVALNADEETRRRASLSLDTDDLTQLLPLIVGL